MEVKDDARIFSIRRIMIELREHFWTLLPSLNFRNLSENVSHTSDNIKSTKQIKETLFTFNCISIGSASRSGGQHQQQQQQQQQQLPQ